MFVRPPNSAVMVILRLETDTPATWYDTLGAYFNDLLARVLAGEQPDESSRRIFKSFHHGFRYSRQPNMPVTISPG